MTLVEKALATLVKDLKREMKSELTTLCRCDTSKFLKHHSKFMTGLNLKPNMAQTLGSRHIQRHNRTCLGYEHSKRIL